MKREVIDLLNEFEGTIQVSDLDIVIKGTRVDYLHLDNTGDIEFWAGNPDDDDYAEELLLNDEQENDVYITVLKYF